MDKITDFVQLLTYGLELLVLVLALVVKPFRSYC